MPTSSSQALDGLEWPHRAKVMQQNWIGRSEGAEFDLPVDGRPELKLRVFTTRPDTSFGMTYAVMAPEHPLVDTLTTAEQRSAVDELRRRAASETDIERMAAGDSSTLEKRGAFTGSSVVNPFNGSAGPSLRGRLRPHGLRHRGDHGGAGRGRARLGVRHLAPAAHRAHRSAAGELGGQRGRGLYR